MAAKLVLELEDGSPIPANLFPLVRLDRLREVSRPIYVRNAGDRLAYGVAVEVTGDLRVAGELAKSLGQLEAGERVRVDVTRLAVAKTGDQAASIVARGVEVT